MDALACGLAAQVALREGRFDEADARGRQVAEVANLLKVERDAVQAVRIQSEASLGLGQFERAEAGLQEALNRARLVGFIEEELAELIALVELRRRRGHFGAARGLLEDLWDPVRRGLYCLLHVDALNVLARVERDAGDFSSAVGAATQAYRLAWCDGPPFAYRSGLETARTHLLELGVALLNDLPPHQESSHEPLPDINFDAPDGP